VCVRARARVPGGYHSGMTFHAGLFRFNMLQKFVVSLLLVDQKQLIVSIQTANSARPSCSERHYVENATAEDL